MNLFGSVTSPKKELVGGKYHYAEWKALIDAVMSIKGATANDGLWKELALLQLSSSATLSITDTDIINAKIVDSSNVLI